MDTNHLDITLQTLKEENLYLDKKNGFYDLLLIYLRNPDLDNKENRQETIEHDIEVKLPDAMENKLKDILRVAKELESELDSEVKQKKTKKQEKKEVKNKREDKLKKLQKAYITSSKKTGKKDMRNKDKITTFKEKKKVKKKTRAIKKIEEKRIEEKKPSNLYDVYKKDDDVKIIVNSVTTTKEPIINKKRYNLSKKYVKFLKPLSHLQIQKGQSVRFKDIRIRMTIQRFICDLLCIPSVVYNSNSLHLIYQIDTINRFIEVFDNQLLFFMKFVNIETLLVKEPLLAMEMYILYSYLYNLLKSVEEHFGNTIDSSNELALSYPSPIFKDGYTFKPNQIRQIGINNLKDVYYYLLKCVPIIFSD